MYGDSVGFGIKWGVCGIYGYFIRCRKWIVFLVWGEIRFLYIFVILYVRRNLLRRRGIDRLKVWCLFWWEDWG